jgi:hypothetical protein
MKRKTISLVMLFFLVLTCIQIGVRSASAQAQKLKIYVGPPKVLADNNVYDAIFVQLQSSNDIPARAQEDIFIHLSSSLTNIGSVDPVITIPSGYTYAVAKFYSSYTPGTTVITATASGFMTVQGSITTVGPVASKLEVYCLPPILPADSGSYRAIIVQLQDSSGTPAKAPIGNVNVTLSSSNIDVGGVDSSVTITAGSTYAVATFYTTTYPGSAVVTAIASGYVSGDEQVTTQDSLNSPVRLKVYVGPPKVPADGVVYEQVAVQFQDTGGKIARVQQDVTISLSSSRIEVGDVDQLIMIKAGETYAMARFYSTFRSGSTSVTAVATDYTSGKETISTVGPIPSKLAVYCTPSNLPADGGSYDAVMVQLQDSSGAPAKDSVGNVNIDLFSSKPEFGNVSSSLVIPFGKTDAVASFHSQYAAGSTTITAITPGYTSSQNAITAYLIDTYTLNVSVTADPSSVSSGGQTTIKTYVTYSGLAPALGVTVKLTSDNGGTFTAVTDENDGFYLSTFKAPSVTGSVVYTILAKVSKAGYVSGQASVQVALDSTVNRGSLKIYVTDTGGHSVSEASVSSTSQPADISSLSGIVDQNGFLSFDGIPIGSYTIKADKPGYEATTKNAVVIAGQITNCTITLTATPSTLLGLPTFTFIALMAIIAAIVIGAAVIVIRKRRRKLFEQTKEPTKISEQGEIEEKE